MEFLAFVRWVLWCCSFGILHVRFRIGCILSISYGFRQNPMDFWSKHEIPTKCKNSYRTQWILTKILTIIIKLYGFVQQIVRIPAQILLIPIQSRQNPTDSYKFDEFLQNLTDWYDMFWIPINSYKSLPLPSKCHRFLLNLTDLC